MQPLTRQRGWTLWGLIGIMVLIGLFALLFLKLFPPYLDNAKIKRALEVVAAEPTTATATRREIIDRLDRILYVDYASDVVDLKQDLTIEKRANRRVLRIRYEVEVPLVYNISALLYFDNHVEIPTGG